MSALYIGTLFKEGKNMTIIYYLRKIKTKYLYFLTPLGLLNFLLLQWFFIRIGRFIKSDKTYGYIIISFVLPLSGWWTNYIYLNRRKKT